MCPRAVGRVPKLRRSMIVLGWCGMAIGVFVRRHRAPMIVADVRYMGISWVSRGILFLVCRP